mmetsp:Transcript_20270/g.47867  ORF Transcript_20270/g.47867 Transcript_20270/m.47867 type:complete len:312 (+) Transcript_20270:34-969(+)
MRARVIASAESRKTPPDSGQLKRRNSEYDRWRSLASFKSSPPAAMLAAFSEAACNLHCSSLEAAMGVLPSLSAELLSEVSTIPCRAGDSKRSMSCLDASGPSCRNSAQRALSLWAAACQWSKSLATMPGGIFCSVALRPSRRKAPPRLRALAVALREAALTTFPSPSWTFLHDLLMASQPGQRTESTAMESTPKKRRSRTKTREGSEMGGTAMPCCFRAASTKHVECRTQPHSNSWTLHSLSSRRSQSGQRQAAHAGVSSLRIFCPKGSSACLLPWSPCSVSPSSLLVVSSRTCPLTYSQRQHTSLYFAYL